MAASKKKRTGARAAVVVVLCLVLVCVVAAAVALGLVSRLLKYFAGEGIVKLYRGGVEVLDKERLNRIARGEA